MSSSIATKKTYINGIGSFLPGDPVGNDDMETFLGEISGKKSLLRKKILRQNGIQKRHYAIDTNGQSLFRNSEMAAKACRSALQSAGVNDSKIDLIVAATTQGDLTVPGFASMVHGELQNPECEVLSVSGVCASGLSAIKQASAQIRSGSASCAVACASEFPSRLFKASRYESQNRVKERGKLDFDTEFLRWMLSDGAGAMVLSDRPNQQGLSLQVDWVRLKSHANLEDVCMYSGALDSELSGAGQTWLDQEDFQSAADQGFLNLKQNVKRLDQLVLYGLRFFLELIEDKSITPEAIDYLAFHYSSERFKTDIVERLQQVGIAFPDSAWFSNLHSCGNTGSASLYIMLEELLRTKDLQPGQKILCMVPESGRYTVGFMQLTVVGEILNKNDISKVTEPKPEDVPAINLTHELSRRLAQVWLDFDIKLQRVPLVQRIEQKTFSLNDYQELLINWRQQVIEGGRWISRAASSVEPEYYAIRSLFIGHAQEEHMDFRMLEKNYVAVGGELAVIQQAPKNLGSEALSAFVFHRATQPNPFDLLGTMFIIEGLGKFKAARWGRSIMHQLNLSEEAVSFMLYHGENDEDHLERLDKAIEIIQPTEQQMAQIVKTARVTARLYCLQLEEIGNF